MANHQQGPDIVKGYVDKRRTKPPSGDGNLTTPEDFSSINSMRTALKTINGGASYTDKRLDAMTVNDMVYAMRLHFESAGVR